VSENPDLEQLESRILVWVSPSVDWWLALGLWAAKNPPASISNPGLISWNHTLSTGIALPGLIEFNS
jgi:hypothetical protein